MFNLRRYFSLTSAVVIIVVTVVLAIFYRQHAMNELVEIAERQNVTLAQSFANFLWPRFSSYVMSVSERDGDTLRARPETLEIHEVLEQLTVEVPVLKVKIYNLDGLTVYSSQPNQIGEDKSNNPRFLRAGRGGAAVSQLSHRETFSAFSGIVEDRDLVESYIPIRGRNGRIEGVFELYADVTPLVVRIGHSTTELVVILLLSFGLMYGCLFLIVGRADLILKKQYLGLQRSEEEIKARNTALEFEVTERKRAEATLQAAHDSLEERAAELRWEITRRRETEHALRRSETRLMAILDNAPVEIYLKDTEGRYVVINRYYERLWGVTKENVRGKLPGQIHEQEDFAAASRAHDLAVLESGEVIEQEDDVLMEDGLHTLHMIKFPIRDAAGEISGLGAIATDVTESKKLQRMKDEFISSVSHELRTPMASVLGALGLIQGGAAGRLPEKAKSMIEITHRNCNRLVRLLNDVLDIEKMESGNSNFEKSLLELGALARDAIESIAHYSAEQGVEVRLVEDVDFVEVMADGDRLIQVLMNLLSNAIKFSPQGGVVEVRISRSDHSARVSVKDCGPGIPEDFRNQVFERFAQADRTDSRCRGGTGLGLSICEMIIDQHDGSIAFDTEIGTGTTFYFDLPDCADGGDDAVEVRTAVVG